MKGLIGLIMFAACVGAALGVRCYAGSGTSANLMDCGTSSDKCVKYVMGTTVAKLCFSQLQMPNIPGYTLPTDGCMGVNFGGTNYEYCVCSGDGCNGSTKTSVSIVLALVVSAVAGYLMM